jgi:AraC family transcriptional regulator, positive regulator of tynA and feaB
VQLAVYDLLGALFAAPDEISVSPHTDQMFRRICAIIKDRFADPDFGPKDIAAELRITPRYLQKLFNARGLVCTRFIQSFRLDRAARLLERRSKLKAKQPLSEIAYACGFKDYKHFSRRFGERFGRTPRIYPAK